MRFVLTALIFVMPSINQHQIIDCFTTTKVPHLPPA